jgi:hypothetical protein
MAVARIARPIQVRFKKEGQGHDRGNPDHEDQHVDGGNVGVADLPGGARERTREGLGVRRPDEVDGLVQNDRDRQRGEQRRDARALLQGPQERPVDEQAQKCREGDRDGRRQRQWQAHHDGEGVGQVAANDEERALREVDEVGDAEHQHETDRQHRVDVADGEAVQDLAQKIGHGTARPGAARAPGPVTRARGFSASASRTRRPRWSAR